MRREKTRWLSLVLSFLAALSLAGIAYAPVTLPLVYVDPPEITANPSASFTININIQDVTALYSFGVKVSYNEYVLDLTNVAEGPFLSSMVSTVFVYKEFSNYIDVGCTTLGASGGVSGSGTLFTLSFDVKDAGKSDLDIFYHVLLDNTLTDIPHETANGSFHTTAEANLVRKSAWPEHHHYVIHKDEDFNGTHANQTLYGKVKNLGSIDLYVYVSFEFVRDDGYVVIVSSEVTVVAPGAIVDLTANFQLNSTDTGKYAATASAHYSYSGSYYAQGVKVKTFSFAVLA